MASKQNPNAGQIYEDFKPLMEEKDTPDALLLLVHLPGFTKEQVGASFEADSRKIRVFGERPLDNDKRKRFKEEYLIPETCDCDKLRGKFDGTVITITMPKKPISKSFTPKQLKKQQLNRSLLQHLLLGLNQKEPLERVMRKVSLNNPDQKWRASENLIRKKMKHQPHQQHLKNLKSLIRIKKKFPKKVSMRWRLKIKILQPQKKPKANLECLKDHQEGSPRKRKFDDEKHEENERAEKKRIQEAERKTSQAGKEPQKVQTLAREASKEKEKGSSGLKTPAEKRDKEKDVQTDKVNQRNYGRKESDLSIGKGIKDIANSASQAVTRLADKFSEEDKQKLLYAGAAILMVAVDIYASFKVRFPGRQ